jgi:hypothetical protein
MRKNKTTKHLATENPGTMKKYLMELFVASVSGSNSQHDLYKVAENWGRSEAEADQDIRRVENIECAVRLFISKAVDENFEELTCAKQDH